VFQSHRMACMCVCMCVCVSGVYQLFCCFISPECVPQVVVIGAALGHKRVLFALSMFLPPLSKRWRTFTYKMFNAYSFII